MSRRTSLDKGLIDMAYDLVKEGHYNEDVAEYLGITGTTFYNWYNRGEEIAELDEEELQDYFHSLPDNVTRKNHKLFLEFFITIKRAQTEAKMSALRNIRKAGKKNWQAEAWYLERKYRHQFGRVTMLEDSKETQGKGGLLEKMISGVDAVAQSTEENE